MYFKTILFVSYVVLFLHNNQARITKPENRVVVENVKDSGFQPVEMSSQTTGEGGENPDIGFKSVDTKDMNLTMQPADISMSDVYMSPEVKEKQEFPWYNHTGFYVTFNKKSLETSTPKELA